MTPRSLRTAFVRHPLAQAAALAVAVPMALGSSPAARAQAAEPARLERVEITGSSIKRIDAETALPVQVIKREEIDKSGVTTAAELMTKISANAGGLSDGASISDGTSGQRGFNSANLRGIGTSSTLVLLNGRRLANFASPGDASGVDLNNIPAAAIQRVEVLKDGASAIYGTDAIGGVVNFITRKDYTGVDAGLYVGGSQHGGAGKRSLSLSGGAGDLAKDRFNVFGVLDVQNLDALRSSQRSFIADNDIPNRLGNLLSSYPYPANINLSAAQRGQLNAGGGYNFTRNRINFSAPGCNPPGSVFTPTGPGGREGCTYNYMADTQIYPESQKVGFLGRAVLQLTPDHQAYAELLQSRTTTDYVLSPNNFRVRNVPASVVPQLAAAGVTGNVEIRLRVKEAGNRSNEVTSDATRLVAGLTGTLAGWDYDAAVNHSVNKTTDRYHDGYFLYDEMTAGVRDGRINPFGPSGAAGQALIAASKVDDDARRAKGTMDSIDMKASRVLMALPAGDLAVALGAEFRRETQRFTPSALLTGNNIQGDRDSSGSSPPLVATSDSRNVSAFYAELNAPLAKDIETQLALRHDRYGGIGSTTNPKVGLRWQPSKQALFRGSFGTGFRAPSISELKRPTVFGVTSSVLPDPVLCAIEQDLSACSDQWNVERRSNPNLKPEKSQQLSFGAVLEPSAAWTLSADYWNIRKKNVISDIGEEVILADPAKYADLITRDEDGVISNILLEKRNQGRQRTSGIDFAADWRGAASDIGRFGAHLAATYVLQSKKQTAPGDAYISNLGKFVNDGVVQRWRHRLSADWDRGPLGLSLANTYYAGYTDQNTAINLDTGERIASNKVKAYSLWDLTASYAATAQLKLRAGILNLFDTHPPFSNQAYYFLASYDPTYTDPRGRFVYVSAQYSFK